MIIDADIHQADYAAWVAHVRRAALRFDWFDFVAGLIVVIVVVAAKRTFNIDVNFMSVLTLALVLGVFIFYFSVRIRKQYQAGAESAFLGAHRYEIDESGIGVSTRHYDAKFKWSAIQKCEEADDYAFLILDKAAALIVPKRSFRDATEWQSFLRLVNENAA